MDINSYGLLADAVVCLHALFVLYAVGGGLLAFWCRICVWLHLPAALWAAFVEFSGWVCPLTPLENWLRTRSGGAPYSSDFIEHYLVPMLYPAHLTRGIQVVLGVGVIAVNATIYGGLLRRRLHRGPA